MAKQTDLYAQFFTFHAQLHPSESDQLVEVSKSTGMSVRGEFIWLVHKIEWISEQVEPTSIHLYASLSTRKGLTVRPKLSDVACLSMYQLSSGINQTGAITEVQPHQIGILPPVALAAPNISLYVRTLADSANWRGKSIWCRIHYTTLPMAPALWVEIAETWAQAD